MEPTAMGYLRVSTNKQGEQGLDAQRKVVTDLWEQHLKKDYPTLEFYVDQDVSARQHEFHKRPQGKALLLRVTPKDCIVLPKLDRGFRDLRDLLNQMHAWDRAGVRVFCPDFGLGVPYDSKSIVGKMGLVLFGIAAEIEGARAVQRTKDFREAAQAVGRADLRAHYGFKNVRRGAPTGAKRQPPAWTQPQDNEQAIARSVVLWKRKGHTLRKIAEHLNDNKLFNRIGTKWRFEEVRRCYHLFVKIMEWEKAWERVKRRRLQPWEFISPYGRVCVRFDKEHLRGASDERTEGTDVSGLPDEALPADD